MLDPIRPTPLGTAVPQYSCSVVGIWLKVHDASAASVVTHYRSVRDVVGCQIGRSYTATGNARKRFGARVLSQHGGVCVFHARRSRRAAVRTFLDRKTANRKGCD